MKNKLYKDTFSQVTSACQNKMEVIMNYETKNKKRRASKKLIIIAAAMMLFLSVSVGAYYYISTLFFVPGVGIMDSSIITSMVSISEPIEIKSGNDIYKLEFMTKITYNGKSDLIYYIDSKKYPENISVNIDGQIITNDEYGLFKDFPDVKEFDFTVAGGTIRIKLTEQNNNSYISKENNGIALGIYKLPKTNKMGFDVIDNNLKDDKYSMTVRIHPITSQFYGENDEEIFLTSGSGFDSPNIRIFIQETTADNSEIKKLKSNALELQYWGRSTEAYYDNASYVIEIPIPKDGETIQTDCQATISSYTYKITEVRREGDVIYFKDNTLQPYQYLMDLEREDYAKYQDAIENKEHYIYWARLFQENFDYLNRDKNTLTIDSNDKIITGFDENAGVIRVQLTNLYVIQLGDFDIIFE